MTSVQIAVFLFALPAIFVGGVGLGYGLGLALTTWRRRQSDDGCHTGRPTPAPWIPIGWRPPRRGGA